MNLTVNNQARRPARRYVIDFNDVDRCAPASVRYDST